MQEKALTDSEKLEVISQRMKRMEASVHLHTAIVIIGFLGIVSLGSLISKIKKT